MYGLGVSEKITNIYFICLRCPIVSFDFQGQQVYDKLLFAHNLNCGLDRGGTYIYMGVFGMFF